VTEQDQDTEVFMSPRDVASGVDDASGSIASAAEAAWDAATNAATTATDWAPIGAEGPAHLPDADGGSPDPWGAPSAGESGGIIEAVEREAANRPAPDDTPPTGTMSDDQPDNGIPPDAETFISQ
jgi:hypothetical protein